LEGVEHGEGGLAVMCMIDSSCVRVHQHAATAKRGP
jgi:hypothetical protein